jgi:hypothetical protein
LNRLRRTDPALQCARRDSYECFALTDNAIVLHRHAGSGSSLLLVCQLRGEGKVDLRAGAGAPRSASRWEVVLTTEDAAFTDTPYQPEIELTGPAPVIHFAAPAAVILRGVPGGERRSS